MTKLIAIVGIMMMFSNLYALVPANSKEINMSTLYTTVAIVVQ